MQRRCSAALLGVDAIANRFGGSVKILRGFDSRRGLAEFCKQLKINRLRRIETRAGFPPPRKFAGNHPVRSNDL